MTIWLHTTILATSVAATLAVGFASAAKYETDRVGQKADLLPLSAVAEPAVAEFVTVEERGDGVSVLARVPADSVAPGNVAME